MRALHELPPVKLDARCKLEHHGRGMTARVKVNNPTDRLAFFVQLAVTQGAGGPEILPVLWDDNYFSLLPGETREISARFALSDAGMARPTLEVGGWNVDTPFVCRELSVPTNAMPAGVTSEVTVTIGHTFLDGSRVFVYWDGKPIASSVAFARECKQQKVLLQIKGDLPGLHELRVGDKRARVSVQP